MRRRSTRHFTFWLGLLLTLLAAYFFRELAFQKEHGPFPDLVGILILAVGFFTSLLLSAMQNDLEKKVEERTRELARANQALEREMQERLRIEKEMVEISSKEQQRFGQDLHDGLSQHLTGISFLVKSMEKKLKEKGVSEAADATEVLEHIKKAITETKKLSRGLNPVELEKDGLIPALQEVAITSEKTFQVNCRAECDETIKIEDHPVATHLYRIAQEAVHNAVRHGKARQILIRLEKEENGLALSVRDDRQGHGYEDPISEISLRNMQYRARMSNALLEVKKEDSSTLVLCRLPVAG